ncbi:MAG: hypothetical protein KC434_04650 [Anaerolineales bacterium]|nr:hypothetical protein [Anaerolineales bacterium]
MDRTRTIFVAILGVTAVTILAVFFFRPQPDPVVGLVGSEKIPFFQDERVQEALRSHGLNVTVQKAGSREIATEYDLSQYDFVFPAGIPAAQKIQQEHNVSSSYSPFFTPMVIASWQPIAEMFVAQGLATDEGGYYLLDMAKLLPLLQDELRWNDLAGNTALPVNQSILIRSTDVRTSNSAAMYLALMSYVANDNNIVQSVADAQANLPFLSGLFLRQGLLPSSTQEPFEDYLVKGMGHSPIVIIYEAQFIAQAALQNGTILPDMVLMYPSPTIFTEHVLIPFSDAGRQLGELLETDPELQKLAIEYGLRNGNLAEFREFTAVHNITLPDTIVNVIEPPSYEVLEGLIQLIEQKYQQGG